MVATANTAAVSNATAAAGWDREVIFKRISSRVGIVLPD
jgi:hypothetical protein